MGARLGMGTLPFSFAQDTHLTMNAFITLFACVASVSAAPQFGGVYHPRVHGVAGYPYAAAGAYAGAPIPAPYNPSSAFATQDEFGNTQYGYSNLNSQKHEVGNTYTGVQGSYSYVDANGVVQTTNYIADHLGFRVQATNLPVAPVFEGKAPVHEYVLPVAPVHEYTLPIAPVYEGVVPESVVDTPEVAAAKAEHLALVAAAAERKSRSTPADTEVLVAAPVLATAPIAAPIAPLAGYGYAGLPAAGYGYAGLHAAGYGYAGLPAAGYGYAGLPVAPGAVVASAPVTAEAELHTVKLNPGHAVAYRVY